jgi:hypothetical protein
MITAPGVIEVIGAAEAGFEGPLGTPQMGT